MSAVGNSDSIAEILEIERLLRAGERLKKLPEFGNVYQKSNSAGLEVPVTSQMDSWIQEGIKFIYSLLPDRIVECDFTEIGEMHEASGKGSKIVTTTRKTNINAIIKALKICRSFLEWLPSFDEIGLGPEQKAGFYFGPLETLVLYIDKEVVPSVVGLEDGRTRKTALLHLYGRICLLMRAVVRLNHLTCCQLLPASLRGLLELYIDSLLIKNSVIENDIEKLFSFSEVYKFRSARNLMRIDREIDRPTHESSVLQSVVENSEEITKRMRRLWGPRARPVHWTCLSLEDRCRRINELEIYRNVYYYGNMYIHSGYVAFPKSEDDAHFLCAYVYCVALEMFSKSTELLCNEVDVEHKAEILRKTTIICLCYGYFQAWKAWVQTQEK